MSPNQRKSIQNEFRDAALSVAGSPKVLMVQINSWGQACVHRGNLLKADRVQEGERELYSLWAVTSSFLILFTFVSFRAEIDFALIHHQWQVSLLLSCPLCTAQHSQSDTEATIPQPVCYYLKGHSGVAHPYPN